MKDQINEVFDSIQMPDACAQQIRSALDQGAVTPKKPRRLLLRSLLAAALAACLLLSVVATGLSKGWLDDFLGESETVENVQELDITANYQDQQELTLERLLMDGPFLYLQVSLRTVGDVNAAEVFENFYEEPGISARDRVSLHIANGMLVLPLSEHGKQQTGQEFLSVGSPAGSFRLSRLDDGSDSNFCSYTMQFLILDLPADYEGLKLRLRLEGQRSWTRHGDRWETEERQVFLAEEEITLTDAAAREAQMEDGCPVKLHSLGVQIHGRDFADVAKEAQDWGVVLTDGTKVPFNNFYLTRDYYEEAAQWSLFSLSQIVDPAEVSAIYLDQTVYPLT